MHRVTNPLSALALTLAVLSAAACTAEISKSNGNPTTPGSGTAGSTGTTTGGAPPIIAVSNCAALPPPRAPLRRLTRIEYNNTMRDLLGDLTSPGNAFPSELSGNGFGNDADSQPVGSELADQYMKVSETVSAAVTTPGGIAKLAACAGQVTPATDAATETACVRSIVDSFVPKAWRRAPLPGEADSVLALFQAVRAKADFPTSVAAMLQGVLQSPEFLYKPEFGAAVAGKPQVKQPTGDEMATRLSYLYWSSTPDDVLRAAASSGGLATAAGVRTQAERLLNDPKSRPVIAQFFDKLLPIQGLAGLARDATTYPAYNPKVGAAMRLETQTFLEHQIFSGEAGSGTWPNVFTADYTYVNQDLAAFYGMAGITGDTFQKVPLDTTKRRGLLTQAGILAGPIHTNHANPVVRGSFVVQKLLCYPIPFPTGAIAAKVTPPDPNSAATARQRFTQHSMDPVCKSCHVNMDPVGYALENFDPIGQYRTEENAVPIDATGTTPLLPKPFNGAIELGQQLAESPEVQDCFATQWMSYGYGRNVKADTEVCSMNEVHTKFKDAGYNIKSLLLDLTQSDAFLYLPAVPE